MITAFHHTLPTLDKVTLYETNKDLQQPMSAYFEKRCISTHGTKFNLRTTSLPRCRGFGQQISETSSHSFMHRKMELWENRTMVQVNPSFLFYSFTFIYLAFHVQPEAAAAHPATC
jgi:hypothetical protein